VQQAYQAYHSFSKRVRVLVGRLESVVMGNLDVGGEEQVPNETVAEDRTLILYVMLVAQVGTLGILFFWAMGALLQLTQNGGQINSLRLDTIGPGFLQFGFGRIAYFSYPVVAFGASTISWLLYWHRRHLPAVAFAGFPVVGTVLFYLTLVVYR
jgi:hypothetical protein